MEDSEEKQETPPENQEEPIKEDTKEEHVEDAPKEEPVEESPPPPEPPQKEEPELTVEQTLGDTPELPIETKDGVRLSEPDKPLVPDGEQVQQPRRTSTGSKRASIADGSRSSRSSKDQDNFMPSEVKSRVSMGARTSLRGSISMVRKSKFGLTSKARMVLGDIVDIKTNAAEAMEKRFAKYQNTYKLDSDNPFNAEKVDKILREVLTEAMENLQYDAEKCASTAKVASTQIRSKIKALEFDRYKLVCIVSIGEKNSQDVYATCRFLWDAEKDRFSYFSMENTNVYAIAYCFGLYYE